jgi:hypothetical protein
MIAEITLSLHMAVKENAETRCDENARLVALRSPEQKMPFGRFWHAEPNAIIKAIGYAMHSSRSQDALISVYVKRAK